MQNSCAPHETVASIPEDNGNSKNKPVESSETIVTRLEGHTHHAEIQKGALPAILFELDGDDDDGDGGGGGNEIAAGATTGLVL